jgi:hypothetical protein
MRILVFDVNTAERYVPDTPTLAIRIFDSPASFGYNRFPVREGSRLQESAHYQAILEYEFDDIDLMRKNQVAAGVAFNRSLARQILSDFKQHYREGMDLMVHCNAGQRRSPAVAGGLNDIFTLGHDRFLNDHPDFNRHVYWTMIDTAIAERLLSDEQQQRFDMRRPH